VRRFVVQCCGRERAHPAPAEPRLRSAPERAPALEPGLRHDHYCVSAARARGDRIGGQGRRRRLRGHAAATVARPLRRGRGRPVRAKEADDRRGSRAGNGNREPRPDPARAPLPVLAGGARRARRGDRQRLLPRRAGQRAPRGRGSCAASGRGERAGRADRHGALAAPPLGGALTSSVGRSPSSST